MRRVLLALSLGTALVALTGCPPTYPKCDNDEHCKDKGEVCVEGQCQECAKNENCKEGFVCESNKCVPKPECSGNADCGTNKKCARGKCVAQDHCDSDRDCGAGSCKGNKCVERGACTTTGDCGVNEDCVANKCVAKTGNTSAECSWEPVRFAFNEYNLDTESRNRLSSLADCIKKEGKKVTLEGHADERGTEEYNLQLSNKRAASVKKYLTDLGVKAGSLDTVGYGENRPASNGHDEAAWAENRRVEFKR